MVISNKINRLLQYRSVLIKLKDLGFETVFSYTLGEEAGVTAEQVRKDFSKFNIKGNKKGGYNIDELLDTFDNIFRKDELHKVILVGIGNIGIAILQYKGFRKNMIEIVAGFDIDPVKYKKKYMIPVYPMERIEEIIHDHRVKTVIIAVPEIVAQEVCSRLVNIGINSILNISPAILKAPSHVVIHNIQIGNALESLIYQTTNLDQ